MDLKLTKLDAFNLKGKKKLVRDKLPSVEGYACAEFRTNIEF